MNDECYFFEKDKTIYAMCIECKDEKHPTENFFFWDGGYGHQYDVICEECNKVIRKYEKENT